VRIVDLAHDLITLSGLRPGEDIEVEFTGVRPGEKLFEELSVEGEKADTTRHPKIFIGRLKPHAWDVVLRQVDALAALSDELDSNRIRDQLRAMIPEFDLDPASSQRPPGIVDVPHVPMLSTASLVSPR
jgi:FlaA1/EpsC-like NDP-sugar epimerase